MADLHCRVWTPEAFADGRAQWQALLARSDADPLFMSWDWQWRWWQQFGARVGALELIGIYDADDELVGLAPLYRRVVRHRGWVESVRLEVIGLCWRSSSGAFSEYLDLIAKRNWAAAAVAALGDYLMEYTRWDDLVLPMLRAGSVAEALANRLAGMVYWRTVDSVIAHHVEIECCFEDYLGRRSASTRRRAFNHRSKFSDLKMLVGNEADIDPWMAWLQRQSRQRWGDDLGGDFAFDRSMAHAMTQLGQLRLTALISDDEILSVNYGVRIGGREYYLRSAFTTPSGISCSPGYLHFGYCIESAFEDGLKCYDLLAGAGKYHDYKHELATHSERLVCHHLVRSPMLQPIYRSYDGWQRARRALRGESHE